MHDSPDYYQLKVSTFNDDKKTELIGETWVDLRDIIITGGGQSDQWHTLSCKGKYAGEIRIEITFYDTRPKPEKPATKSKQQLPTNNYATLPRGSHKRRPLPSEPVTVQSPVPSVPEHVQTPPRSQPLPQPLPQPQPQPRLSPQPNPPYGQNQLPMQAADYHAASPAPPAPPAPPAWHREQQQDHYAPAPPSGGYATSSRTDGQPQYGRPADVHDKHQMHADEHDFTPDLESHDYDPHGARSHYDDRPVPFDVPDFNDRGAPPIDDDIPPPPPVHRSRNNSGGVQDIAFHNGFDASPQKETTPTMRHDVLRSEAHRRSIPSAYPGRPTYKPYDSAPAQVHAHPPAPEPHHALPQRHYSYDSSYDSHPRHPASTMDDPPELPSHHTPNSFRTSGSRLPQHEHSEPDFTHVPSPAPLNLGNRGITIPRPHSPVENSSHWHHEPSGYSTSPSPLMSRDYQRTSPDPLAYDSHDAHGTQYISQRSELDDTHVESPTNSYVLPPVPPSLVPGIDPCLALELSSRINEERRQQQRQNTTKSMATPPRGRKMIEAPPSYSQNSSPAFSTPQQAQDRSPVIYSGGTSPTIAKPRPISPNVSHSPSPNPHHTIRRKSISPAPPPDGRRLSGVPFGPDSFDALNPSIVSVAVKESAKDYEKNGKIIAFDGREIDPSDHLPENTWAPEPEPKQAKGSTPTHHRSPSGGHPTPPSGRRPLRIAGQPQSIAAPPPQYISGPETPSPPASTGRNKLQKKANRQSAMPAMSGSTGSGPLALIPHPRQQDNYTPPRVPPRANTFDYPNENQMTLYGSSGGRGPSSAPPIPAKIPVGGSRGGGGSGPMMSGALPAPPVGSMVVAGGWNEHGTGSELSLMEEMRSIDIGTGRARRHQIRY